MVVASVTSPQGGAEVPESHQLVYDAATPGTESLHLDSVLHQLNQLSKQVEELHRRNGDQAVA
jgi:hypothetical protein